MHYSEASYRRRMAIEDELLNLMQEVPFEQITVLDIAQRQDIARKTFYRYFPISTSVWRGCWTGPFMSAASGSCGIRTGPSPSGSSMKGGWPSGGTTGRCWR